MPDHVLVVESHPQTRHAICELLGRSGLTTRTATSVSEAFDELDRMPSLVVLDVVLPDGSGVDVLEAIHAAALPARVAVLSSGADGSSADWIAKYQPDAVFGKPLDLEDFVDWLGIFDVQSDEPAQVTEIETLCAVGELVGSVG